MSCKDYGIYSRNFYNGDGHHTGIHKTYNQSIAHNSIIVSNKSQTYETEYFSLEKPKFYDFAVDQSTSSFLPLYNKTQTEDKRHNDDLPIVNPFHVIGCAEEIDALVDQDSYKRRRKRKESMSSLPVSTVSVFSAFSHRRIRQTDHPKRSIFQLLLHSSIMFGREFCYAVEGGMTTPILLSIGLPLDFYSLVWAISPVLGFILQPVIGGMSDRCTCNWGRRRPFILGLAFLLLIGLTLFLNGEHLVDFFIPKSSTKSLDSNYNIASSIAVTVTGVVLFDFSADFIEGPIRAYAMDVCNEEDVKRSLLFQAIFTGAGGAFGYASGGISWVRDTPMRRFFPSDRQFVYVMSAFIFILFCICNLLSIEEIPQENKILDEIPKGNLPIREQARLSSSSSSSQGFDVAEPLFSNKINNELFLHKEMKAQSKNISLGSQEKIDPNKFIGNNKNNKRRLKKTKNSRRISKLYNGNGFLAKANLNKHIRKGKKSTKNKIKKRRRYYKSKLSKDKQLLFIDKSHDYGTFNHLEEDVSINCFEKKFDKTKNLYQNSSLQLTQPLLVPRENKFEICQVHESDEESVESCAASFRFMLERHFPYASVDPAFKHLHHSVLPSNKNLTNTNGRKKIFPGNFEETTFSDSRRSETVKLEDKDDRNSTGGKVGGIKSLYLSIKTMPKELIFLCVCHLFGWVAFLSIALFFTDFVGQVVMKGKPHASNSRQSRLYERGVEIGNWGLTINATVSCLYCGLLKLMIRKAGFRSMYVFGYVVFTVGACFIAAFPTVTVVLSLSSVIGIMSATLYTIPYMLVAQYHEKYKNEQGNLSNRGAGIDCALVTCMIQLAQIVTGLGIGALVKWTETVLVTVVVSSIFGLIGGISAAFLVRY